MTSRDIASLVWIGALLLFALTQPKVRESSVNVLRALAHWKVLVPFVAFALYVGALVAAASRLGLWDASLTKDFLAWLLLVGFALVLNSSSAASDKNFLRDTLRRTVGIGALLEFYMNLVVFPFIVELVLQPVVVLLGVLSLLGHAKPTDKQTAKFIDALLGLLGVIFFTAVTVELVQGWGELDQHHLLLSVVLPVWLTVGTLPFIYAFALTM